MLQAFWDPQVKVANHTSVLQKYFNYKHSFIEPKKIISLMVSVNADLIYTTIPDVETAVKINERSSAFSPICIYIFLWKSNHLWDVSVVHIILPKKKKEAHSQFAFLKSILIPSMSHQSKKLAVQHYFASYFCMPC